LDESNRKYRTAQTKNDVQVSALLRDAQALRQSKDVLSEQHRAALKERDDLINALNMRVDDLQHEVEVQEAAGNELMSLKHKLQKAEIDLAISQDELRDLKMIDLKDAEETIESLESTIQTLRMKARADETNTADLVTDLRCQVQQLEAKLYIAERGIDDTKHLHDKAVSKMQGELEVLKQENEALNVDLKEKFHKLNERHSTITSLTAQKNELELKESRLLAQIKSLESDCQRAKEEQEKTALALERRSRNNGQVAKMMTLNSCNDSLYCRNNYENTKTKYRRCRRECLKQKQF
jgi:chromosome segregation ATPase